MLPDVEWVRRELGELRVRMDELFERYEKSLGVNHGEGGPEDAAPVDTAHDFYD